ncbi:MAG: hypothetical protein ACREDF_11410, partial [Thermoplasmata archaeon]
MFTNLMKSSLVAMLGMAVVGSTATPAEAHGYVRRQHVSRPTYVTVGRSCRHYQPVVVERPRYYTTPAYYDRPVIYTEPVVYREPVVYQQPVVAYSQPSCYRSAPVV